METVPNGLNYPANTQKFVSTYDAWTQLIKMAEKDINFGMYFWTLEDTDTYNLTAWEGDNIYKELLDAGTNQGVSIRVAQGVIPNFTDIDTENLAKDEAIKVRSVPLDKLLNGGALHTKLITVDGQHMYIGSANSNWRSFSEVQHYFISKLSKGCQNVLIIIV